MTGDTKEPRLPDDEVGMFVAGDDFEADFPQETSLPELYGDEDNGFDARIKEVIRGYFPGQTPSVVYPGSSSHIGVARAAGAENVLHVDPQERAIEALQHAGYRGIAAPLEELSDYDFDMAVFLNSHVSNHGAVLNVLNSNGVVIANNYTQDANFLAKSKELDLVEAYLPHSEEGAWVGPEQAKEALGTVFLARVNDSYQEVSADHPDALEVAKFQGAVFVFRSNPDHNHDALNE